MIGMPTMQQMSATQLGPLPPGPGAQPGTPGAPGNMPQPRSPMVPPQPGGMGQQGAPPPQPQQPQMMPQQLQAGARSLQSIAPQLMGGVGSPPGRSVPMENLSLMARNGNAMRPGALKGASPAATLRMTPAELAHMGRLGDSFIAHLTPGEIAVPPQVQTPQLMQILQQAFQAAHVDVNQFTVGSPKSSINPHTGVPEYNIWSALLPIGGAVLGNLVAPGMGSIIGGALGGGVGGALNGGGLSGALLGAGLGGLGGWAGNALGLTGAGGLLSGAADTAASTAPSVAGTAGAVGDWGNLSNFGSAGSTAGSLESQGLMSAPVVGAAAPAMGQASMGGGSPGMPTVASGVSPSMAGGPSASTGTINGPGTAINPASPVGSVGANPVTAGSGNTGGFGDWIAKNKSWLPLALGGVGALAAMSGASQSQTAPMPAGFNDPMHPLNPNFNALLGNAGATQPTFTNYNPVRAVSGRHAGYSFYPSPNLGAGGVNPLAPVPTAAQTGMA